MSIWRSLTTVWLFVLSTSSLVGAAENVWSVESFNSRKAEWDQLLGATIRIEGRVTLSGGGQLRLAKCEVPIHAGDTLIKPIHTKKTVEITGRLKKDNGKLILEADRIQIIPTDLEQYEIRSTKLRIPKPADWYELGDWASERSKFYDDGELAKKAMAAYDRGIAAEWKGIETDDAEARFQLAKKVARYGLPDSRRMELIHEADRIEWNHALKSKQPESLKNVAAKLVENLPGSAQPLADFPAELKEKYDREPLATYRESIDDTRKQLHRLFYTTVLMKIILDDASKDGRNGDAIAERLEQQVPEARQLANQYRTMKLSWRLEHASTATRPEIEQLAADFRARQQPDQAKVAVTQWLQAQQSRFRQSGPVGLLQLADEYLVLLQDEQKAVSVLVEANKQDPAFAEVSDKLKSLGYANVGGTWIKGKAAPANEGPGFSAIPGGIAVGMPGTAARGVMGGRPGSLGRVLTKRGPSEVWSYGQPGTSRLVIRLEGTSIAPELHVVDIKNER